MPLNTHLRATRTPSHANEHNNIFCKRIEKMLELLNFVLEYRIYLLHIYKCSRITYKLVYTIDS